MSEHDPYRPPEAEQAVSSRADKPKFGPLEWIVVAIIVIVLVALLLPAFSDARPVIMRTQCKNNLKQIALALHNYHDVYEAFPPAVVYDEAGRPMHSWRVLLLPYVDEQELYDKYRLDEPWNGPNNIQLLNQIPSVYRCPSFLKDVEKNSPLYRHLACLTNYVLVTSPDGVFFADNAPPLKSVTDGSFQTIMAAEARQHAVQWSSPEDVTPGQLLTDLRMCVNEDNSNHKNGLHVGYVDGSVRWIPHDIPESDFHALITGSAGDEVSDDF